MTVFPITTLRLDQIRTDPRNVFTHQDGDLQRLTHSISEHGFLSPVIVDAASHDAKTDTYQLVGGEARAQAAALAHLEEVPAVLATFASDEQRTAAAIALNAPFGSFDDAGLTGLLRELGDASYDLDMTALTPFAIEDLLSADLGEQDPNALWQGMPEFENDRLEVRQVVVKFATLDDVADFASRLNQPVTPQTKSIWFPKRDHDNTDMGYAAADS